MRKVKLWQTDVTWENRDDGSVLVWQKGALPTYPDRLSTKIEHWATTTPDSSWMAERGPDGEWQHCSYGELLKHVRCIGQALLDLGLNVDRPLVILSGNSIAHGLMALAAQYVGIPSAAIAPAYSLVADDFEKLKSVQEQITPGAVFVDNPASFTRAIEIVFPNLPIITRHGADNDLSWEALLATPVTDTVASENAATGPDTIAKFLFTSGTTGSPKAVIQTQGMICSNMAMVADCYQYLRNEPPILLDWAPWNHVASGNKVFNMAIYNGGTFYIDGGKPTAALIAKTVRNLREVSPTWYFNVPVGYEMLVEAMKKDESLASCFFKDLKLMLYAGATMATHTWEELDELARTTSGEAIFLTTGLGATETAPFALFNTNPNAKPGNLGIPAKGLTLKLVPNEEKWEARVRGPSVTPGYWRNEALSREAFDDEGYYCLGDALRFADPENPGKGFYFDGRVAENFKMSSGTWVGVGALRAALTDALQGLARDVVIVGEGRSSLGALLVPYYPALQRLLPPNVNNTEQELLCSAVIRKEVATLLARYNATAGGSSVRVPRVMFLQDPLDLDKGEVTDKGSVNQRAVLRQRAKLADALFEEDCRIIQN